MSVAASVGRLRDVLVVAVPLPVLHTAANVAHDRDMHARVRYALQAARALQAAVAFQRNG